jgi:hypothetical protein
MRPDYRKELSILLGVDLKDRSGVFFCDNANGNFDPGHYISIDKIGKSVCFHYVYVNQEGYFSDKTNIMISHHHKDKKDVVRIISTLLTDHSGGLRMGLMKDIQTANFLRSIELN